MVVLARLVNAWPFAFVVGSIYERLTTGLVAVTVIWAEERQFKAAKGSEVEIC